MVDPDITVRVALDDDPDEADPDWTDITSRVHYGAGGQAVEVIIGRQDESSDIKPTEMSWAVRNGDDRFTPNNSSSPYAGKWEQGRRSQIAETVGGEEFVLGTCFLEIPDMPMVDPRSSQPVVVSAIDRLGRLESGPAFEGTLVEHVRTYGGELVEHWPLTDSYPYMSSVTLATTQRAVAGFFDQPVPAEPEDLLRAADVDGPPGDDQRYAHWTPVGDAEGDALIGQAYLTANRPIDVPANRVIAVSVWLRTDPWATTGGAGQPGGIAVWLYTLAASSVLAQFVITDNVRPGAGGLTLEVQWNGEAVTELSAGRNLEREAWRLVTARLNLVTGRMDLWCGADVAVSTVYGGTVPMPAGVLENCRLGEQLVGAMGQVQIRVGDDATTMTREMHLAQYAHGYRGLDRQTVAERIVTLAGLAGVPATEVDVSAAAATPMQPARLAGANPAAAIRAAGATGQDLVLTDAQGRITAVPRAARYNQPVALQIPWGWIGWRGLRHRPDKPITDVTVSRSGGGTVRLTDRVAARRYGMTSAPYELDTAIPEDAANLARWTLTARGKARTRCPSIRINMLRRSIAERKALLRLKVGDRIELTGLPAGSPDDLPDLVIQGIKHTIGPGRVRLIEFNTSPLLGPVVGEPPPCPMVGDLVSPSAIVAY